MGHVSASLPAAQHYLLAADHRQGIIFSMIMSFGALPTVPSQYAAQPCTDCLPCSLAAILLDATCFVLGHSLIAELATANDADLSHTKRLIPNLCPC